MVPKSIKNRSNIDVKKIIKKVVKKIHAVNATRSLGGPLESITTQDTKEPRTIPDLRTRPQRARGPVADIYIYIYIYKHICICIHICMCVSRCVFETS